MRKNVKTVMVMLLVMGLVFSAGNAVAFGPGGQGGPEAIKAGPQIMADLDLTIDQIKKLKKERVKSQKQMIKLRAELQTLLVDLRNEVGKDESNLDRVDILAGQIGLLEGKMIGARTKSVIYLRSILTPEQKRRMDVIQLQAGGGGPKGHKGGHRGGGLR